MKADAEWQLWVGSMREEPRAPTSSLANGTAGGTCVLCGTPHCPASSRLVTGMAQVMLLAAEVVQTE